MQRIKILWLIKGLGPGGAEQLLLLSARVADHERFDYRVAYVRPDKTHLVPEFEELGIRPQRLGAGAAGRIAWVTDLRQLLREVDVVHAHSPVLASTARLVARTLTRSERPSVVTTEHNEWTSHRMPTRLLNGLTTPLDAHHWAVSEQVRDTMWASRQAGYPVLIHGIDTDSIETDTGAGDQVRAELGVPPEAVVAITVANLRRNKDYPNLLNATKLAIGECPELRVIAVGQGPLEAEIHSLHADLGLGEQVRLLGFRRDVHRLMGAADFFVLSSAHEGLPVAVMEAFAAGLPVVATAVGGLSQQVADGVHGLLVPPADPQALATAMVRVGSDAALRRSLAAAAQQRSHDYDIRVAVATQEEKYAELAGSTATL